MDVKYNNTKVVSQFFLITDLISIKHDVQYKIKSKTKKVLCNFCSRNTFRYSQNNHLSFIHKKNKEVIHMMYVV